MMVSGTLEVYVIGAPVSGLNLKIESLRSRTLKDGFETCAHVLKVPYFNGPWDC